MNFKQEVLDCAVNYSFGTYAPKLILVEGKNCLVKDIDDNEYLDFTSGIAVCNLGHCHPEVTEAIQEQAAKLCHCSNLFYNENQPRLAKTIADHSFGGRVFFCNSGAEANEGMIKLARRWGHINGNRHNIICIDNAFHGRTLGTLAATGKKKYLDGFAPDVSGFTRAKLNNIPSLENAYNPQSCAVLLELVQGEGGIVPATAEFIEAVRNFCNEKNMLLMIDEIQTGIGRTGKMFAYQHYNIIPDVISMAKGLGNGFPIGAFTAKQELNSVLPVGTHGTTFGGNPMGCAAALAVFRTINQENILANCQIISSMLFKRLNQIKERYSCIQEVRGLGLLIGVQLSSDVKVADVITFCSENGLLVLSAGENVLRLLPPLTVTREQAETALEIIEKALQKVMEI
ncbi:MAG: aspartate aminotransferase family protein [Lentisphaeria bacterium]